MKYKLCFLLIASLLVGFTSAENTAESLVEAALERTQHEVRYDPAYLKIDYPNGDVPAETGVCTDVVIRSYRALGIDLQQLVHEDMKANFQDYPSKRIWGMNNTDTNIDHRRVPNLQTFFVRHGESLPISKAPADYKPGDIVTWTLAGHLPHIGIVSNQFDSQTRNPLIVHNIGAGPVLEDMLFNYSITGHYRYLPSTY